MNAVTLSRTMADMKAIQTMRMGQLFLYTESTTLRVEGLCQDTTLLTGMYVTIIHVMVFNNNY